MLMVAPSGSTNDDTLLETPRSSSAVSIVTGSVALEDEVEKAMSGTLRMRRKNSIGLSRASTATIVP
jgi:hypothetical protein